MTKQDQFEKFHVMNKIHTHYNHSENTSSTSGLVTLKINSTYVLL